MQDAARVQAAIECLDAALSGQALERVLTAWGRSNRFAGSKDRAAIRDYAYQAWRCRRSAAWLGGAPDHPTGRALMIGVLRQQGADLADYFNGARHAPAPLDGAEHAPAPPMPSLVAADLPDWQAPLWQARFGEAWHDQAALLRHRAPAYLRVNLARSTVTDAMAMLAAEGIETTPLPDSDTALRVERGERHLKRSAAFMDGLIEMQDAASQALAAALPLTDGATVLDYCAGGGGKSLALAARPERPIVTAHDANLARMADLPARAARAQTGIECCDEAGLRGRQFDVVLCDSPCSGSGSWRRDPEGKWALTASKLSALTTLQSTILTKAAAYVLPSGYLIHATCSVFSAENQAVVNHFLVNRPDFETIETQNWAIGAPSDGFGKIVMKRKKLRP